MTDNATTFTMRYTAHPDRRTAFQREVEAQGRIHGTIEKGKPWQNGIVERSMRTDNEECLRRERFRSSEERRLRHRLYEMDYNSRRPHQGIGGRTPLDVYRAEYPYHVSHMMLN